MVKDRGSPRASASNWISMPSGAVMQTHTT
jgi:hypothetical protein